VEEVMVVEAVILLLAAAVAVLVRLVSDTQYLLLQGQV
jgi:hypothetical protein